MFEILVRFYETKDWMEAFFKVIPKRKGIEVINVDHSDENKSSENGSTEVVLVE